MIGFVLACQGTPCIRTDPTNYLTSSAREYSVLRNRADLSSTQISETPGDGTDFE